MGTLVSETLVGREKGRCVRLGLRRPKKRERTHFTTMRATRKKAMNRGVRMVIIASVANPKAIIPNQQKHHQLKQSETWKG